MKVAKIIEILEENFPKNLAYEWDNVGLLAGNAESDVSTVLVTLDITPGVVKEAIECGAEMIISHHPLVFEGVKNFTEDNAKTKMYAQIIRNNLTVYCAHTNLDCAPNGLNQRLAEVLGLSDIKVLDEKTGLGRYGKVEKTTASEFAKRVADILNTPFVKFSGDPEKEISTVAVGSGACGDEYPTALSCGADIFVTADVKYHIAIEAVDEGLAVIDAGHYPTEIIAMENFSEILADTGLTIKKSKNDDIFSCIS